VPPFLELVKKSLFTLTCAALALAAGSAIWLMTLGTWLPLWPTVLAFSFSPMLFPILLLPAAFLAGIMRLTHEQKPGIARAAQNLSLIYLLLVLSGWAALVFGITSSLFRDAMLVPALGWSVAVSCGAWAVFCRNDRDNVFFIALVWMLAAGCAVAAAFIYLRGDPGFWVRSVIIAAVTGIFMLIWAIYEAQVLAKQVPPPPAAPEA
jgi:hypothetical protein